MAYFFFFLSFLFFIFLILLKLGSPSSTSGRFDEIPDEIHVLITHGPAFGKLDSLFDYSKGIEYEGKDPIQSMNRSGSRELEESIRHVRPGLHLHGLCKEARGYVNPHGYSPLTLNSSMCDPSGSVLCSAPFVVKCNLIYISPVSGGLGGSEKACVNSQHSWEFVLDSLI
jgi:hypothetical protein